MWEDRTERAESRTQKALQVIGQLLEHQVLDKGVKVTEYLTVHLGLDTVGIGEPWHVSGRWESNQIFLYHSGPSRKNRFFRCLIWK